MAFSFFGGSTDPSVEQVDTLSPQQKALLEQLTGSLGGLGEMVEYVWDPGTSVDQLRRDVQHFTDEQKNEVFRTGRTSVRRGLVDPDFAASQSLIDAPGPVPGFDLFPGAGQVTQQAQGLAGPLLNQSAGAFGRGVSPLNAQSIQQGSEPFFDAMMNQFTQGTGPGSQASIASNFGALDSARSSGLGNAIGRQTASFGPASQGMFLQNRAQDLQGGLAGMGLGAGIGARQDLLNQGGAQGALQKFQMGLPGMDPRMQNLSLSLGIPSFGNIGFPGTETPGALEQFAPLLPFFL